MKLRFTALAITLAAASAFCQTSRAQGPNTWKPVPVQKQVGDTPRTQGATATLSSAGAEGQYPGVAVSHSRSPIPMQGPARHTNSYQLSSPDPRSIAYGDEGGSSEMPMRVEDSYPMGLADYSAHGGDCHVGHGHFGCGGLLGACSGGGIGWMTDQCQFYGAWGGIEYTQAWAKGRAIPILATTGNPNNNIPAALGQPDTVGLFGGNRIGDETQSGGRLTMGLWLDPCQSIGVGTRLFGLEGDSTGFHQSSLDLPSGLLGIPYYDFQTGAEDAILVASPNQLIGTLGVRTAQDVLTAEAFLRTMLLRGHGYRLDLIGGYHYTHIRDELQIMGSSVVPTGAQGSLLPDGSTIELMDHFDARNNFHGGELGLLGELRHGRWRLRGLSKVSLGNMRQTVTVSGQTTVTVPPPNAAVNVDPTGLFAQQSNSGTFKRDETAFIPEASLTLGYLVTNHLELSVGYSFIYWSDVVMAGEQIDRVVDLTAAGGGPVGTRPAMNFHQTDFWVQGINLGLNWNY